MTAIVSPEGTHVVPPLTQGEGILVADSTSASSWSVSGRWIRSVTMPGPISLISFLMTARDRCWLPEASDDANEQAFAKLKALLRKIAARSAEALGTAIDS